MVGQSAITIDFSAIPPCLPGGIFDPVPSFARIVGHKPITISEMVRVRARGLQWDCPHGVTQGFQVTSHEMDPVRRARNLFSKHDWRLSLGDKAAEFRPEMAFVFEPFLLARNRERLTGATTCPNRSIIGPTGSPEGEAPASDSGEEMALGKSGEVARSNISNIPFVNDTIGD
jgi:hypothetical protein